MVMQDEMTHQGHMKIQSESGVLTLGEWLLQGILVASDRNSTQKRLMPKGD